MNTNTAAETIDFQKRYDINPKRTHLVIDIETVANPAMVNMLPEPSIDNRLKDPAKIIEAERNAKKNQLDKMALSPLTGKVVCIGYYSDTVDLRNMVDNDSPEAEKLILDHFYSTLKANVVITYNGKGFDIPFLFKRGIMLGCKWATIPEMKLYTDRYKSGDSHIDVMAEFCNYGEYEKLDNLGRYILGKGKEDFDVTAIAELMKTPEGQTQVSEYCRGDCVMTWELAKRMGFIRSEVA